MAYQLTETSSVIRLADMAFIPEDPANPDYVAYQAWLEAGGKPKPVPPRGKPKSLSPKERLEATGLTVEELKQLLGLS